MPKLYVDGFVIPVPRNKVTTYTALARKVARIYLEHGALEVRECVAEDSDVKFGIPFPKLAKAREDETVFFSWITYKSRAQRDAVNARVMADERLKMMCDAEGAPFDCKRMAYGGFQSVVAT
ncbi:MAG: DUF1428 domain-containing protein [Verrucomicrobiae bacterium]|nr:DUF1428 domain-containing protein [Verrucomicrobiae bacterium]